MRFTGRRVVMMTDRFPSKCASSICCTTLLLAVVWMSLAMLASPAHAEQVNDADAPSPDASGFNILLAQVLPGSSAEAVSLDETINNQWQWFQISRTAPAADEASPSAALEICELHEPEKVLKDRSPEADWVAVGIVLPISGLEKMACSDERLQHGPRHCRSAFRIDSDDPFLAYLIAGYMFDSSRMQREDPESIESFPMLIESDHYGQTLVSPTAMRSHLSLSRIQVDGVDRLRGVEVLSSSFEDYEVHVSYTLNLIAFVDRDEMQMLLIKFNQKYLRSIWGPRIDWFPPLIEAWRENMIVRLVRDMPTEEEPIVQGASGHAPVLILPGFAHRSALIISLPKSGVRESIDPGGEEHLERILRSPSLQLLRR